ncbi:MAG: hypothetical protein HY505_00700 [Candidatus Yanofskybacteria bacterium]|nr:hypothetical protein [Candidatus Yanofskybacteria bacterium]
MAYILGLILVLGLIFSATTGVNFSGDLWNKMTNRVSEFSFPKSQKEIVIDNLKSQSNLLDRFFSDTALNLLQDENISPENKKAIQTAIQSFGSSKDLVSQIEDLTKNDKSITKAFIEKVFNLDTKPELGLGPDPTSIPPNCNLVCGE